MMGNGLANIIAAVIVAVALVWNGYSGRNDDDKAFSEWHARAVGDIRNDIVVNCGCCGDEGPRKADAGSF